MGKNNGASRFVLSLKSSPVMITEGKEFEKHKKGKNTSVLKRTTEKIKSVIQSLN